ncbi:MAG TPA: SDR family oxidoreductase [Acidimicrobiia bacterium]|jgi:NAD(P)-dependent dehydrogenase (short-subunit alcohol dehydrogenase family)
MTDRSVLVTGASSGIGEACALHLAARGWLVFAGVRRIEDGERVQAAASGAVEPVLLDVTDAGGVERVLADIRTRTGGRLTAVVNNAGIAVGGPIEYLPLDDWRRQFEVNVFGQLAVTRAALPLIRTAGSAGRVVFIGSIGGRLSTPLLAPYDASKFALEAIAESLRHELRPSGIKVVLVEPGGVKTPIWEKGRRRADEIEASLSAEARERYGWAVAGVRKGIDMQERQGVAPGRVAQVVENALTTPRPRARYLVGLDARATAVVARVLPDSARDAVVRLVTRP